MFITALAPLIWGSTYLVTSQWLPESTPLTASTVRALPAGILLVLISHQWLAGHWWWRAALLGFLNVGFFFVCLFSAAYLMPGGVAAMLISSQPLWAVLLSALILHERITLLSLVQCAVGILGVALLVGDTNVVLNRNGIIVALLGAMSMALGVVLAKKWSPPDTISLAGLTGWQLLFGGLLLVPIAWFFEGVPSSLSTVNILAYAYLAIPGAMVSYVLWFYGVQKLPTGKVVILGFISPLTATVLGYAVLDESLTALQFIGVLCIGATLLLPFMKTNKDVLSSR